MLRLNRWADWKVLAVLISTFSSSGPIGLKAQVAPVSSGTLGSWELAYGTALMSDYNVRGITQSAHNPSGAAYIEPRYNQSHDLQLYLAVSANSVDFPNEAKGQLTAAAGIRPKRGPFEIDLGIWYLMFPGGRTFDGSAGPASCTTHRVLLCNTSKGDVDFWEVYGKPSIAVNERWTVAANIFYSPSVLNSGAFGTYAALQSKLSAPRTFLPEGISASISAELGRYWFGSTDAFYGTAMFPVGIVLPSYVTWNVGLTISLHDFAIDLRYYDTDLTRANCNVLTGDHTATFGGLEALSGLNPTGLTSSWCGAAFIAKLTFDGISKATR
jgi:Bacterial protein of unknown function (Gcw_chp)